MRYRILSLGDVKNADEKHADNQKLVFATSVAIEKDGWRRRRASKNWRVKIMPIPKGSKLSSEHRWKISQGVKNSKKWQKGMLHQRNQRRAGDSQRLSVAERLRVKAEEKRLGVPIIFLTKPVLNRFVRDSSTHQLLCYRCDEILKVGDLVVSRSNSSRYGKKPKRKYYHTHCWQSLFFECSSPC